MSSHGTVMGFSSILLPQLMSPDSPIEVDESSGSWIASVTGLTLLIGNIVIPPIMSKYGRKNANILSIIVMMIGWVCNVTAYNVPSLIFARLLQGMALGMTASMGSVLIGEYTSPKNRGAFLATISLFFTVGVLIVHTFGTFLNWHKTALVCAIISLGNLIIVMYSPESPSWLIDKKRYSEGEKVFRWLRGDSEENELRNIISAKMATTELKGDDGHKSVTGKFKDRISYFNQTIRKKEFYKPVLIMTHIYFLGQWSGANILAAYTEDIFHSIIGEGINIKVMVISVDVQRFFSNFIAIFVIKKVKRRTVLAVTGGLNVAAYLITAGYCYSKDNDLLLFDHPYIGIMLIHFHMLSIATGTIPLPFILAGELYPLEYRGLAGSISVLSLSFNVFVTTKTFPFILSSLDIYGTYCLYASIVLYCLVIALIFLPETKDRTLRDIEEEFRGHRTVPEQMKMS
ncbi:facilitated trehalose transporter Tret1-like [Epargyreus clarus]|uniref:facilitated trehalose transporter Tret1-like n=1 Tax=Epargyreus clarus TaxID=520877 RepID=UPI003C2CE230